MVVARNYPLFILLASAVAFHIFGLLVPHPGVSFTGSIFMLVTGAMASVGYVTDAWRIMANPAYRDPTNPRSHHLVLGVFLVSIGAMYGGLSRILWISQGSPDAWMDHPYFYAHWFIMGAGFWVLWLAPEDERRILTVRPSLAVAALIVIGLTASFFLGTQYSSHETEPFVQPRGDPTYPVCPPDRQVLGSGGEVYHEVGSPFRLTFYPRRCFLDAAEAEAHDFRPPG